MKIQTFIQTQILLPRLRERDVLVVYDPDRRYRDLCLALASESLQVVDASESSIESREAALLALQDLGRPQPQVEGLLIYVPGPAPANDEEKQRDPFSLYAACGSRFPQGDGDEYMTLCLRAKADHATEIRRLFQENPNPDFALIDAVGSGQSWVQLSTLLGVESAREILFAFLAPSPDQQKALKAKDGWRAELNDLLQRTLGLRLLTKAKSWGPMADELWRFLLFSEFVFDLPGPLPDALANVPRASAEARPLVEDLCERLRQDGRTQAHYIERAETIEDELNLPTLCQSIQDLGILDTFPFEERSFFAAAADALRRDNVDRLRDLLSRHRASIWTGRGENQSQWQLLQAAASLMEACEDASRQLPDHTRTQQSLIDFYLSVLRGVDRLQRECEGAAADQIYLDSDGQIAEIIEAARRAYRKLMDTVQLSFLHHLEQSGWPPAGRLANADLFDKLVAPLLHQSGQRVALFLIDALRYELGVELQKELQADDPTELEAACAQLPTVTPVGMASLLPGAGQRLALLRTDQGILPSLDGQPLAHVSARLAVLRSRYGQRFHETPLADFVQKKVEIPATTELLVLRSNEMDQHFESNPDAALSLIVRTFQQIRGAIHKLRRLGYHHAIIATDHGFYLNPAGGPGDACAKPPGNWVTVHARLLLGDGVADRANSVIPAQSVGIRGDWNQVAIPRAMVAYQAGQSYLHGGGSLQEALVPVLTVRLSSEEPPTASHPKVTLRYKRGGSRITTRLPVVELAVEAGDLFSMDDAVNVLLEAHDKKGNVVGEAKPGGPVNPATRTLSLNPGETVQVTLKMEMDFEGKFTVKALDPVTLTTFHKLDMETDYTV